MPGQNQPAIALGIAREVAALFGARLRENASRSLLIPPAHPRRRPLGI